MNTNNTNHKPQCQTRSVCNRPVAVDRQERIKTLVRYDVIMAALLITFYGGHAAELARPGEAIDAGDSYQLKDGSRVSLHRVVNEVAIKHLSSKSVEPTLREAGVNQDPLAPLVSIDAGRSNIVDVYYSEDSQAVADLMNVQEEGVAVFPVLINPASRRRMIATDEIIVQFSTGIGGPQAVGLPWMTHFQFSSEPFGGVYSPTKNTVLSPLCALVVLPTMVNRVLKQDGSIGQGSNRRYE